MHSHIVRHHISREIQLQECTHTQVKAKAQQEAAKIVLFFRDKITKWQKERENLLLHKIGKGNMRENVFANIPEVWKLINKCRSNKIPQFIHFETLCRLSRMFSLLENCV